MANQTIFKLYRILRSVMFTILGGGVTTIVIVKVKIWLLSPSNLILGDILRSLAFSEFFFDEKKVRTWQNHILDLQW